MRRKWSATQARRQRRIATRAALASPRRARPPSEGSRSPAAPTRRRATRAGATEWRKLQEGSRVVAIASAGWLRTSSAMPQSRAEFSNAAAFAGATAIAATELLAKAVADAVGGGGGGEPANGGRLAAIASVDWLRTTSAMPHSRAEFSNAAAFAGAAALASVEPLSDDGGGRATASSQQHHQVWRLRDRKRLSCARARGRLRTRGAMIAARVVTNASADRRHSHRPRSETQTSMIWTEAESPANCPNVADRDRCSRARH